MKCHLPKACFVCILLLQAFAASAQFVYENSQVKAVFNYKLDYNGKDTSLFASLEVNNIPTGEVVRYGRLELNDRNVRDKDSLSNRLFGLYRDVAKKYSVNQLKEYTQHIKAMVETVSEKLDTKQLHSLVFQSLCMFYSLAQAPVRDIEECGYVPFTVMESYLNGLASFSVEEDSYLDIRGFKEYLTRQKELQPQNPGIDYYLGALQHETAERLNMVQITARLQAYFDAKMAVRWPQGSECGCCGNYAGPCYYWSKICLAHDYACQSCTPRWACFSGCVPSSCSGNTIAWYWWIL